ncbi:MAG: sugar phosphate isomerase/epimerase [Candidatus Acidiferrum sp.]
MNKPMNRRSFIQSSLLATAASALPLSSLRAARSLGPIGVQLYTVRDAMKLDMDGTLAKVAAVGYREVEFAGYFDKTPQAIRAMLDAHHLTAPSAHRDYAVVENNWMEALDAAHTIGHKFLVCPWIDEKQRAEAGGWKRAVDLFNRAGEASQKAGIQFGYHNHSFEFEPAESLGGKLPYDFFLAELDPKLVKMELDLCWISVAGKDPLVYFDKYPGRFPLVHVKDFVKDPTATSSFSGATGPSVAFTGRLADVGTGSIDWKRIFAQRSKAGIQHFFVEHDEPKSPFDSIRVSYDYLAKL